MPAPVFGPADVGGDVTLRIRTATGPADAVGTLLAVSGDTLTLRRRDGRIEQVPVASVEAARRVPPGPARRITVRDLQLLLARGWRPLEQDRVGDWLLRASGGFTRRANSALALGNPGLPATEALGAVQRWYDERRLPATIQLCGDDVPPALAAAVDAAGWTTAAPSRVMTGELAHVLRAAEVPDVDVRVDDAPDESWLALYRHEAGPLPAAAHAVLVNHPTAGFASVRDADRCLAIARVSVDDRWAGLFAVEVATAHRRRGLARAVTAAALRWAGRHGARHVHLQVGLDNAPALALYERLGFTAHHDYVYRVAPGDGSGPEPPPT